MKLFRYQGKLYIRCIPGKNLFRSTMVHEAVTRGDVFAVEVDSQRLTIIPGTASVEHLNGGVLVNSEEAVKQVPTQAEEAEAALKAKAARERCKVLAQEMARMMMRGINL